MLKAKDIMTTNVVSIRKDASIEDLSKLFLKHKVNGLPVMDEKGKLAGIVTEGDLIDQNKQIHIPTAIALFDAVIFLESQQKFEEELKRITGGRVEDIYTADAISVSPESSVQEVASLMADKDIHTIPVLDQGKLVGIIGKTDIISGLAGD
ncbi:MAG: CBS domain-containing protein [Candidatus Nitrohelix vancouverensis]|uniref:CBS domain-containing protein n=1 Tax=Candidatus Nitrohelix vancouverensis TaxID=2705534 RepID=A0A7T0C157_9BACT|nr:MAG: CBS domain-containing protein [Candidatus Nitrohelix vancouverensis]